ncbi:ABC transporter permease [Solirhodobacter olei]|uniref:ABC transporter permease n=1 Tax=Solirhodobacter olei TaxID=2493082 RepID=UPI000FDAFA76|nr:ABC transporter permease [Solirhodobacter olei]
MKALAAEGPNATELGRDARSERWMLFGLSLPALLLVGLVVVLPIAWLFLLSFQTEGGAFTLANYQRLIDQPSYRRILAMTFEISLTVTAMCIVLGYALAYLLAQLPRRVAGVLMLGVLMPFWTSILVRTYAWLVLLQRDGLINVIGEHLGFWQKPLALVYNMEGTVVGLVHIMLPFMVLPLYNSMRAIDRDYVRGAANLGAGPIQVFWHVYLPLSRPGLFAGGTITFILCLGSYVTPAVLGGGKIVMAANGIAGDVELYFSWGPASAFGVVLLVITLTILFTASRFARLDRIFGGGA